MLLSNQYDAYIKNIIQIVRGLKIKSLATAYTMNRVLLSQGDTVGEDQSKWKYFLNLSGQPYVSQTSPTIVNVTGLKAGYQYTIVSLGTTSTAQWISAGLVLPTGLTDAIVGLTFTAKNITLGTGTVSINHLNDPTNILFYSIEHAQWELFTPANLQASPITWNVYKQRGNEYQNILAQYNALTNNGFASQELLVEGIIFPIDFNTALSANDNAILYYDTTYIEPEEENLIPLLQTYIDLHMGRWDTPSYAVTDMLYVSSQLSILYAGLVTEIINIRLANCKTNYVHSYHIMNYLAGYFRLDKLIGSLTRDQLLWLYRNINDLILNGGKKSTLDYFNSNFVVPYGFSLNTFTLHQTKQNALLAFNAGVINSNALKTIASSSTYGTSDNNVNKELQIVTNDLAGLLKNNGVLNPILINDDLQQINNLPYLSQIDTVPVGIIECGLIQITAKLLFNVKQEKINHWLYLAANDYISYYYNMKMLSINVPAVYLSPKDAAALLLYCVNKYANLPVTAIAWAHVRYIMHDTTLPNGWASNTNYTQYQRVLPPAISALMPNSIDYYYVAQNAGTSNLFVASGYIVNNILTITNVVSGILNVGNTITSTNSSITTNTYIIGTISGSGGIGTYTINTSQTVGSVNSVVNISSSPFITDTAGSLIPNTLYYILTLGNSPQFTAVGASNNLIGTVFTASGIGSGTGTALRLSNAIIDGGGINWKLENSLLFNESAIGIIEDVYKEGNVLLNNQNAITITNYNYYDELISSLTLPTVCKSINDFLNYVTNAINSKIQHRLLVDQMTDVSGGLSKLNTTYVGSMPSISYQAMATSEMQALVNLMYTDNLYSFISDVSYSAFFTRLGVDFSTFNQTNLLEVINNIVNYYIGLNDNDNSSDAPYASVVAILDALTSYTVKVVTGEIGLNVIPIDWCYMDVSASVTIINPIYVISDGIDIGLNNVGYLALPNYDLSIQTLYDNASFECDRIICKVYPFQASEIDICLDVICTIPTTQYINVSDIGSDVLFS